MLSIAVNDYAYTEFKIEGASRGEIDRFANQICYGFQQGAEKLLKAFLWSCGQKPQRTHDLSAIFESCYDLDPGLEGIRESCLALTAYATAARYPESLADFFDGEDAFLAANAARKIKERVLPLIERNLAPGTGPG